MNIIKDGDLKSSHHQWEDRMRLMADSLPALIAYIDREHRYQLNNKAYEEWFAFSREDMQG